MDFEEQENIGQKSSSKSRLKISKKRREAAEKSVLICVP
jgi:hypothetical protein